MTNLRDLLQYYLDHQKELMGKYQGRYIVITKDGVGGDFENERDAYFTAEQKYGLGTFIVQLCAAENESNSQHFMSLVSFC